MNRKTKMGIRAFALFWIVVFATVPLMYFIQYLLGRDTGISFTVIILNWLEILPYFVLFCIHNFLLVPLLLQKKILLYSVGCIVLFALFTYYIFSTIIGPPAGDDGMVEAPPGVQRPFSPEVMKVVIGALLILVNLGIKAMVRSAENERKVQELRAESLAQQMEVLRYQINPHFFMNTLNNIQSLVLTEPEKATECISEFSKLMRMDYEKLPDLQTPRSTHIVTTSGDDILAFGGHTRGFVPVATAECFSGGKWQTLDNVS